MHLNLTALAIFVPINDTLYFNGTVWSRVPFADPMAVGQPLSHVSNLRNWTIDGGQGTGWSSQLVVPDPAPDVPDGFVVLVNITANVV
jgi:hypothetical protein